MIVKNYRYIFYTFLALIFLLSGCASNSSIVLKPVVPEEYYVSNSIPEKEVIDSLRPGDVLLRMTNHPQSIFIALSSLCGYSHSALITEVKKKMLAYSAHPTLNNQEKKQNNPINWDYPEHFFRDCIYSSDYGYKTLFVSIYRLRNDQVQNDDILDKIEKKSGKSGDELAFTLFCDYDDKNGTYCSKFVCKTLEKCLGIKHICPNDYKICQQFYLMLKNKLASKGIDSEEIIKKRIGEPYLEEIKKIAGEPSHLVTPGSFTRSKYFYHVKTWKNQNMNFQEKLLYEMSILLVRQLEELKKIDGIEMDKNKFNNLKNRLRDQFHPINNEKQAKEIFPDFFERLHWQQIYTFCYNKFVNTLVIYCDEFPKGRIKIDSERLIDRLFQNCLEDPNVYKLLYIMFPELN